MIGLAGQGNYISHMFAQQSHFCISVTCLHDSPYLSELCYDLSTLFGLLSMVHYVVWQNSMQKLSYVRCC